jgi:nicotinamide-nucleotide amidase
MDPQLEALSRRVGDCLKQRGLQLAVAESCTGGWVAEVVTAVSGSSEWFERGWVTYSDAAKQELLGVAKATLDTRGAVSEETAREMAVGALAHSRAAVSLAVTGIAGPTGGTALKPVGTVCFAWCRRGALVDSQTRHFCGEREQVRRESVLVALEGLLLRLDSM